jgi:hypothetical protein
MSTAPLHPSMSAAALCGYCGSRQIGVERKNRREAVCCAFCGIRGPWAEPGDGTWAGAREAIAAWNLAGAAKALDGEPAPRAQVVYAARACCGQPVNVAAETGGYAVTCGCGVSGDVLPSAAAAVHAWHAAPRFCAEGFGEDLDEDRAADPGGSVCTWTVAEGRTTYDGTVEALPAGAFCVDWFPADVTDAPTLAVITDAQVLALRAEAVAAGDDAMLRACDAALFGSEPALATCAEAMAAAAAMNDDPDPQEPHA